MKKQHHKQKLYDTDTAMKTVWYKMVRDFRTCMGPAYGRDAELALNCSVPDFRNYVWPDRFSASPYIFKMEAQLENLFKRYRFKNDLYSDEELANKTVEKFGQLQLKLAEHAKCWQPKQSTFQVLQRARRIVKTILSSVDLSQASSFGRFSTRATVGCPASDAYLDQKLRGAITGSHDHVQWFITELLATDENLRRVVDECSPPGGPIYDSITSLPLVGVPKSFKSLRLISPNSLIGSYYTYGLGWLIREALCQNGIDIRKQQQRHRSLARKASISKQYVTADMSSASESFTWALICRLLPREWLRALDFGRLRYYNYDGVEVYYCSFMAMGIGFTFPLQTLLFYAIVEAIRVLFECDGFVSVYGDDLIYPRRIHDVVVSVFTDIGFTLNRDKTFVQTHFRESCGGDYFHGVDVRPFQPEGSASELSARRYESWLYKLYNGLLERWEEVELPQVFHFLRCEITRVSLGIKQVPPSYPVTSGIRVSSPLKDLRYGYLPVYRYFRNGSRWFTFDALVETFQHRYVSCQQAYLWNVIREAQIDDDESWSMYDDKGDTLIWLRAKLQPKRYRGVTGRRLIKRVAATSCKLQAPKTKTSKVDPISDWI